MTTLLRIPPFHRSIPVLARRCGPTPPPFPVAESERAQLAGQIRRERVGGSFWAPRPEHVRPILVVLSGKGRERRHVAALLEQVLAAHDARDVLLVRRGPCRPTAALARRLGIAHVPWERDPHALLDGAVRVYADAVGDIVRLTALRGVPAILFGPGGMLDDQGEAPFLRADVLADILDRTAYHSPFTSAPIPCAEAIALLADWRRTIAVNRQVGACLGMSRWKRRRIADFLATAPGAPPFLQDFRPGLPGAVAVWATRQPPGLEQAARACGTPVWRVEDGFVRSIGLGSALMPPSSITIDTRGIYYDPARESDLEHILATAAFPPALRARAARLVDSLVRLGISKYGATRADHAAESWDTGGRRTILVPGQVADDQSVRCGGGRIGGNLELLQAVRDHNPDAFIVYRPHPDVEATHRLGHMDDSLVMRLADRIDRGGAILDTIARVDEVHTLTSLAGFEALMRGRRVVTYGVPFYAGWGLTVDLGDVPARRTRRLSLEDLVAGVLILFPRYLDPLTRLPCGPEILIDRLQTPDLWRPTPWMRALAVQTALRKAWARLRTVRAA
ncbi:capsule polysaccharide export protein [Gluconacetobacter sacchari DSM 12717]|uniref:Capsule biosynthesis protein n=2 Tax=Gluconacetobacter sacchari TaxID=92759 RepID=A0A7W4NN13_9PROT|nr:capsule biosynthesis protein [Gluconacetobacter sacchari]MBB2160814.1 capsule biosynthesis protein [Gluconacetobacter sacchari]GBQ29262.1 capsule polysaccharide export protein [Gluconacetobacter sacchari DSM 12717]